MSHSEQPSTPDETTPPENPRAFAVGTGVVVQVVGTVLTLGGCFLWSTGSLYMKPTDVPAERWSDFLSMRLPAAAWTIGVVASFVGGIGLIGAGVGLQGENKSSGRVAMLVTGILALIFLGVGIALLIWGKGWFAPLPALGLAIMTGFLFMLAGHSASVLRRFPPPPDQNLATPEILEEHRRRREERLREMD